VLELPQVVMFERIVRPEKVLAEREPLKWLPNGTIEKLSRGENADELVF
jgi:hypothetical protein